MRDFPLRLQHTSGEVLALERDRVLVGFASPDAAAEADQVLSEIGLMAEEEAEPYRLNTDPGVVRFMKPLNRTETRVWARTVDGTAFRASSFEPPNQIIEWIAPVYRLEGKEHSEPFAVLAHVLLINLDTRQEHESLAGLLDRYGLQKDTELSEYLGEYGYFRIKRPLEESSIELRSRLIEQGHEVVRDVRFETMPMFVPLAYIPNDPDFGNQWNMRRIRAGGAGQTAWNISRGDPSVVICILDTGCDLSHPDLDFVNDGINLGKPGVNGAPVGGPHGPAGHGTWCAGIAAATIHNGIGVAGVAGRCRILPVAFQNWTSVELARGIRYAAQNGAHVLSMSFGFTYDFVSDHVIISPAIQEAFDNNVVMCAATGNDNSSVGYPATNPLVIACGATGPDDNRISPTSPVNWLPDYQGSNFGSQINVVAPGVNIPTTDMQGSAGSDTGDYITGFLGTSAATPHVAGLAALVISANSTLTNVEVQTIIERTADKVGDRLYLLSGLNGTWNEEMGYGRINAYRALRAAVIRGGIFDSKVEVDKSGVFDTKGDLADKMTQIERPVDPGEEVKRVGGYENPFGFDQHILEHIVKRLENLEWRTGAGQPFIPRSERPDVGRNIARRADENE